MTTNFINEIASLVLNYYDMELKRDDAADIGIKIINHYTNEGLISYSPTHSKFFLQLAALDSLDVVEAKFLETIVPRLPYISNDVTVTSIQYEKFGGQMQTLMLAIESLLVKHKILDTQETTTIVPITKHDRFWFITGIVSGSAFLGGAVATGISALMLDGAYVSLVAGWGFAAIFGGGLPAMASIMMVPSISAKSRARKVFAGYKMNDQAIKSYFTDKSNFVLTDGNSKTGVYAKDEEMELAHVSSV